VKPRHQSRRKNRFFSSGLLDKTDLGRTIAALETGQSIFFQGDPGQCRVLHSEGQNQAHGNLQRGKEATIALLGVGNFLIACNLASCPSCP
jgi:hypothetical protein